MPNLEEKNPSINSQDFELKQRATVHMPNLEEKNPSINSQDFELKQRAYRLSNGRTDGHTDGKT